jgi:hypothetical protein
MSRPVPARHTASLAALWFGLFAAPAVWSVQLLVLYPLVAHSCFPREHPLAMPVIRSLSTATGLVTAVALAVALLAGLVALRSWRAAQPERESPELHLLETGEGRSRFMAFGGVVLSGLFLFGILMNAVPLLLLGPCG